MVVDKSGTVLVDEAHWPCLRLGHLHDRRAGEGLVRLRQLKNSPAKTLQNMPAADPDGSELRQVMPTGVIRGRLIRGLPV